MSLLYQLLDSRFASGVSSYETMRASVNAISTADLGSLLTYLLSSAILNLNMWQELTAEEKFIQVTIAMDAMIRHGPFFLWATYSSDDLVRKWVKGQFQRGYNNLKHFEMRGLKTDDAAVEQSPSLQSVLFQEFCKKAGCDIGDLRRVALNEHIQEVQRVEEILVDAAVSGKQFTEWSVEYEQCFPQ